MADLELTAVLVSGIQDIAVSGLGFPDNSKIYDYPLEQEIESKKSDYLRTTISGIKTTQAISVNTYSSDIPHSTSKNWLRRYTIEITLYYPFGKTGYHKLIDAVSKIKQRIAQCDIGWSIANNLTQFEDMNIIYNIVDLGVDNTTGLINRAVITITGNKVRPDY